MIGLIPAAGRGTRSGHKVKELMPVGGRPVIDYSLDILQTAGIKKVILIINKDKEAVAHHVVDRGFQVAAVYQQEVLGTGHAVALLSQLHVSDTLLYLMPDAVMTGFPPLPQTYGGGGSYHVFLYRTDRPEEMGTFRLNGALIVTDHVEKRRAWPAPHYGWGAAILTPRFVNLAEIAWMTGEWRKHANYSRGNENEFTIDDAYDVANSQGYWGTGTVLEGQYEDSGTPKGLVRTEALLAGARGAQGQRPDAPETSLEAPASATTGGAARSAQDATRSEADDQVGMTYDHEFGRNVRRS